MRICQQCGVVIKTPGTTCPLCNQGTIETDDKFDEAFPNIKLNPIRSVLYKTFLFLTICIATLSVLTNIFVFSIRKPWFIIVIAVLMYLWSFYFYTIKRHKNYGKSVFIQSVSICLLTFSIDIVTGFSKWSVTYVMPCVLLAGSIIDAILIIAKPLKTYEYMIFEIALLFLCALPFVFFFLKLSTVLWTGIFCLAGAVLCFIAIMLFCDKDVINEIKRRFHF